MSSWASHSLRRVGGTSCYLKRLKRDWMWGGFYFDWQTMDKSALNSSNWVVQSSFKAKSIELRSNEVSMISRHDGIEIISCIGMSSENERRITEPLSRAI